MLYVGIGFIYVNELLLFINVLLVGEFILKVCEREVGF